MPVSIAVLGDRNVEQLTHREIDATLALLPADVDARWLPSPEAESAAAANAVWVVPGTPYRDDDAVLEAIRRARTAGMPILGTCGGFQYMSVEFARNVAGVDGRRPRRNRPGRRRSGRCAAFVQPGRRGARGDGGRRHPRRRGLRDRAVHRLSLV